MTIAEWKDLKPALESRGYKVSLKGRSKREYIAEKDDHIVDIYRGGITGTDRFDKIYIYNVETDKIDFEFEDSSLNFILDRVDEYDFKEVE